MFPGKLKQAVHWATDREGGWCLLPDNQCTKTGRPVVEVLRENHQDMRVLPVKNTTCATFEEYEEVSETLDFTEDDVTWVVSKLSRAADELLAEAIELCNWILRFGCLSKDLRVVVTRLADWMANYYPSWAAYYKIMACCLVVLDKRPRVRPCGDRGDAPLGPVLHCNEGSWGPG